jgi:hypothetical protein
MSFSTHLIPGCAFYYFLFCLYMKIAIKRTDFEQSEQEFCGPLFRRRTKHTLGLIVSEAAFGQGSGVAPQPDRSRY